MFSTVAAILFLFLSLAGSLPAQDHKSDSLRLALGSVSADTMRVNILVDLGRTLYRTSPSEALQYCHEAIELARKLDFKKGLAQAYKCAGLAHFGKGEFAETISDWQESRLVFESIGDKSGVANILSNIGAVYYGFGEDTKALEFYFEARKTAEATNDSLRIVTTMINIGAIYLKKPVTYDKAIEIYLATLPLAEALRDQDAIGTASVNLGEAYFKKGDYPSALTCYIRSRTAFENSSSGDLPFTLTSIGNVYAQQGDYKSALLNQQRALDLSISRNARPGMLAALLGMANTYRLKGQYPDAVESFKKAQVIAKEINSNFELRDAYAGLADLHASAADFSNAYKYQVLLTQIKDTLYLNSNDNLITQQQLGYDLVKKEGEVELQKLAIQKQRIIKNSFLAGLISILIIAFVVYRNYLSKVKINRLLDKQKDQIESLLLNILPQEVARELQDQGAAIPRDYQSVSVLFTDFKDFSKIAEGLSPNDLVTELDQYFQEFDNIIERNNLEKIKTIGDAYMCAGGIPTENSTHPMNIVKAGLEMQAFMHVQNRLRQDKGMVPWGLRIGVHTGPIVAGVVGRKKYAYDIWGNTVNIASRMESNGEVGKVNISSATYNMVKDSYKCEYRGKISAKNIGEIDMYFIDSAIITPLNQ
jgi:class 3 adenylate cyclase